MGIYCILDREGGGKGEDLNQERIWAVRCKRQLKSQRSVAFEFGSAVWSPAVRVRGRGSGGFLNFEIKNVTLGVGSESMALAVASM